jgi:pimeloyl-ACP methyl ester carboxylesterase
MSAESDLRLEDAQAAFFARRAAGVRVRRSRWSRGETQVAEIGDGPPLLLVHGGLDNAFAWTPLLGKLARTRRVIAVDLPGHGLADPFDYAGVDLLDLGRAFLGETLDALRLPVVDIAAHSLGGLLAVAFALDAPQRVSRLVLVGAPAGVKRPNVPLQLRIIGLPFVGQRIGRFLLSKPTRDGDRRFWGQVLVVHPERLDGAHIDADVASQRRNAASHLSLLGCVLDAGGVRQRFMLGERWHALRTPTVFLWGERDTFLSPAEGEQAIAACGASPRVIRIPDAGHVPWIDQPERVVVEIERFLAS